MKLTIQRPAEHFAWGRSLIRRPAVRFFFRFTGAFFGAFALACLSVGRRTLPVAACLTICLQASPAIAAVLGAVTGYFVMFPFLEALEPAAGAVMLYALGAILRQSDLPETPRTYPLLAFCATCSIGLIYAVGEGGLVLGWLAVRCALAVGSTLYFQHVLPQLRPLPEPPPVRQSQTAQTLRFVGRLLRSEAGNAEPGTVSAVYDAVTERVCRHCPGRHNCFERSAEETYRDLREAAARFLPRGQATAADFPGDFLARCRQADALVGAVNEELSARLTRLQASRRLGEYRAVLAGHYRLLADLISDRRPVTARGEVRYVPELGVRSLGRRGAKISGDRGASFVQGGVLYVLLCDGMGTGADAAQEAKGAIALLGSLLKAGARPEEALQLLSGVYILRDSAGFSTVDLAVVDLSTGTGELCKWGAAPSYVLRGKTVRKIGTASPPPGVSVRNEDVPDRVKLSLQRGEKLVLLSDGLDGPRAEACLAACGEEAPQKIASEVVVQQSAEGEDDLSAVVLQLYLSEVS